MFIPYILWFFFTLTGGADTSTCVQSSQPIGWGGHSQAGYYCAPNLTVAPMRSRAGNH